MFMDEIKISKLFFLLAAVRPQADICAESYTDEELEGLFALAKAHDLSHVVAYALYESGAVKAGDKWYDRVQKEQISSTWRYEQISLALDEIREIFENGQVAFVPLKGSVIRTFYAQPWLRSSCDIDVLVHEEDLERASAMLEERGWSKKGKNFHDVSFYSPIGVHLELHYNITEQTKSIDAVLEKVWEYSECVVGKTYEHRQTPEFLMFHLLAHMSYHFISGGCGIRPFLDIWLLRDTLEYDARELDALCEEAQLLTFKKSVNALIDAWMCGVEHTELTARMEGFILGGGVYGTTSNRVILEQAQSGTKGKNILFRLFMPYSLMKERYPVLKKHKWLLPLYWVVRWCQVFTKKRFDRTVNEIRENAANSDESIRAAQSFLAEVGLNPKNR
jgi:hypothetical protein